MGFVHITDANGKMVLVHTSQLDTARRVGSVDRYQVQQTVASPQLEAAVETLRDRDARHGLFGSDNASARSPQPVPVDPRQAKLEADFRRHRYQRMDPNFDAPQPVLVETHHDHDHLKTAVTAAGAWKPDHGNIEQVPKIIASNPHDVDLFHRIHRHATVHKAEAARQAWLVGPGHDLQFIPTDATMLALPEALWEEVFARTPTADRVNQYVSEVNDCDKHAQLFSGLCAAMWYLNGIGQVIDWSGSHSYNAVLQQPEGGGSLVVKIVEPQASGFVADDRIGKQPYTLQQGLVLFG